MEKLQKRSNIARLEALSNALPVKWDFPRSKDIIKSQSMAVAFFYGDSPRKAKRKSNNACELVNST